MVGYTSIQPWLERVLGLSDTCGVHNLHGMPGLIGGIGGAISAACNHKMLLGFLSSESLVIRLTRP